MAADERTYVLANSSCDPVVTHEDREAGTYQVDIDSPNFATASDPRKRDVVSELGCRATPNGIDNWAEIKTARDGWDIFHSET
jgi:hypothetical protein